MIESTEVFGQIECVDHKLILVKLWLLIFMIAIFVIDNSQI